MGSWRAPVFHAPHIAAQSHSAANHNCSSLGHRKPAQRTINPARQDHSEIFPISRFPPIFHLLAFL
jgi:hypothetical protein